MQKKNYIYLKKKVCLELVEALRDDSFHFHALDQLLHHEWCVQFNHIARSANGGIC